MVSLIHHYYYYYYYYHYYYFTKNSMHCTHCFTHISLEQLLGLSSLTPSFISRVSPLFDTLT